MQGGMLAAIALVSRMLAYIAEYICASLESIASHRPNWDMQSGRTETRIMADTPSFHFFELPGVLTSGR